MTKDVLDSLGEKMTKTLSSFKTELTKVRTGRATPALLDGVKVDYYGTDMPINQVASVSAPEPRQIVIQPWEANMLPAIEKAILKADLGLNPQNDGKLIRVPLPMLTEERRKDLVKQIKKMGEECKIALRNERRDANEAVKQLEKDKVLTQDDAKKAGELVQKKTDEFVAEVDKVLGGKEKRDHERLMPGLTDTPKHIAIIMDGNGRWAERRGRPRIFGHVRGCARLRDIIRESDKLGVKALTLYAFSSENWGRPATEVGVLMRLLYKWLIRERREMMDKNIRLRAIGALEQLPEAVRKMLNESIEMSKQNTGLQLTLAVSYSGRDELTQVAQRLARRVAAGELTADEISDDHFAGELSTSAVGDPDLLIRTSGEQRISNFLLWQLAYTELYFTDTMWPDFKPSDLRMAIDSFTRRQRRFGLTAVQADEVRV